MAKYLSKKTMRAGVEGVVRRFDLPLKSKRILKTGILLQARDAQDAMMLGIDLGNWGIEYELHRSGVHVPYSRNVKSGRGPRKSGSGGGEWAVFLEPGGFVTTGSVKTISRWGKGSGKILKRFKTFEAARDWGDRYATKMDRRKRRGNPDRW